MNNLWIGRWCDATEQKESIHTFVLDTDAGTDGIYGCYVVAPEADRARIEALFAAGAYQVLIGDSALNDPTLVSDVITKFGGERIGIWLPVKRTSSNWNLDCRSNADFSFVSISTPIPRWMMLTNNGDLTDVDALWWAGEMLKAGCSSVMVSVDKPQDEDLLACAEMSEIATDYFWLDTGSSEVDELRFWAKYGHVQKFVVPAGSDIETMHADLNEQLEQESAVV